MQRTVAVIVALNSLLLVVPWHTNIPQGENLPEYTHHLQSGAVAFVIIFAFEVSVQMIMTCGCLYAFIHLIWLKPSLS